MFLLRNQLLALSDFPCMLPSVSPLYVTFCFSLVAFEILPVFNIWPFNYDVSWSRHFGVHFDWDSLCFLNLSVFPHSSLGTFTVTIFSYRCSIPYSFSSPSIIPIIRMLLCFMLSCSCLKLYSYFLSLFCAAALPGYFFLHFFTLPAQ